MELTNTREIMVYHSVKKCFCNREKSTTVRKCKRKYRKVNRCLSGPEPFGGVQQSLRTDLFLLKPCRKVGILCDGGIFKEDVCNLLETNCFTYSVNVHKGLKDLIPLDEIPTNYGLGSLPPKLLNQKA